MDSPLHTPDTRPCSPLIALLGPTGSGKSEVALRLAARFGGEIVSCDSVQVFRFFNIGTAKTPEEDRRGIPHHLIDALNPKNEAGRLTLYGRFGHDKIAGRLPALLDATLGCLLKTRDDRFQCTPERVRQLIAIRTWEGLPSTITLTASVGVASGSGAHDAPRLLLAASEGMQIAKREGRDRIVFR